MSHVHHILCHTSVIFYVGKIYRAAEAVMTSTQVTPVADSSLAPAEGFVRMHFLVVADQDRSRRFYRAPSGADVPSEPDPVVVKVANSWLILNAGGGPTEDKPTISYELDKARAADLRHRVQRDAHARAARRARRAPARLNVDGAQCQALFASSLQRSDALSAGVAVEVVRVTMRQLGIDGCSARIAQESGDHLEAAAEGMRWVRSLLSCP